MDFRLTSSGSMPILPSREATILSTRLRVLKEMGY